MRHVAVRRLAVLLGAVFLLWAGVFARIVRREAAATLPAAAPTTVIGAALFDRHCASCHTVEEMRTTLGAEPGETRRLELERFLDGHGNGSAEEDRQILDYLADLPSQ